MAKKVIVKDTVKKSVKVDNKICSYCHGTGIEPGETTPCPQCGKK